MKQHLRRWMAAEERKRDRRKQALPHSQLPAAFAEAVLQLSTGHDLMDAAGRRIRIHASSRIIPQKEADLFPEDFAHVFHPRPEAFLALFLAMDLARRLPA
ncbi:hypothetical protein [Pseudoroseomonas ludipueritiae]|uniref:Uncharacterized protein n=1 Tax=Pseudoroseomonas ludipueritiae TaxID=198093 RepID=A0ABR7R265_9PROT|nr:hypothetical protein [Pseudoroseomonas ludipueritiae]MBC9175787.1 hypothetical protein [Pseudoroseomonas ludipueritiae]